MNIWLVNPFDPLPGESLRPGRYAFIAELLVSKGHRVTWWTSNFFHTTKSFREEVRDNKPNLKIIQLPTPKYKNNISFKRIWNHYVYAKRFEHEAKDVKSSPDIIIASCPPLSSAKVAVKVAKKLGTKCVIDIQDLWPETFEILLPPKLARIIFFPLRKYADTIYSSSDALMSVSKTYIQRALSVCNNEKLAFVLYIGVDMKLFDKYINSSFPTKNNDNEFWAVYIGTIGRSYDIKTILNTAEILKHRYKDIKFFIVGDGPQLTKIEKIARHKKLINCRFLGFLKFENMVQLLGQSEIGLNAIVENAKNAFPNKVFDYIAAGLPVISSIRGELEQLLKSENIGIQYEAGDLNSLKDVILELYNNLEKRRKMGKNARRLAEERFDKNKEYPKIEEFLEEISHGRDKN